MHLKTVIILFLAGLFSLILSCCNHLNYALIPISRNYELLASKNTTDTILINTQVKNLEVIGHYNFMKLRGYEGHMLRLNSDSTFSSQHYSYVIGIFKPKKHYGKWSIASDTSIILRKGCKHIELVCREYNGLTFLVPPSKLEYFNRLLNKNKDNIIHISALEKDDRNYASQKLLLDFSKICYLSWVK